MTQIIWLLGLLVIAYLVRHWFICPGKILKKRHSGKNSNGNMAIVFDLHGVILQRNYWDILKHMLKHVYRLDLAILFLKPSFVRDITKLLKKSRVPEEFIVELSKKHQKMKPMLEVIIAMMNEQRVIPSTVKFIKKLKKEGYEVYLFSNIGEKTFEKLEKKFPEIFRYFDGIVVAEQQDDWIQKPYPAAFAKFLARFGLKAHECIFIDNNRQNIKMALIEGFFPILYQSPSQLKHELLALELF